MRTLSRLENIENSMERDLQRISGGSSEALGRFSEI
jgi:hypothetical protein